MNKHRDGLTARCPWFEERCDWGGIYVIKCRARIVRVYRSRSERNAYYKTHCCADGCAYWDGGCLDARKGTGTVEGDQGEVPGLQRGIEECGEGVHGAVLSSVQLPDIGRPGEVAAGEGADVSGRDDTEVRT